MGDVGGGGWIVESNQTPSPSPYGFELILVLRQTNVLNRSNLVHTFVSYSEIPSSISTTLWLNPSALSMKSAIESSVKIKVFRQRLFEDFI